MAFLLSLLFLVQPTGTLVKGRHADVLVIPVDSPSFMPGSRATLRLEVRPKPNRRLYAPGQEGYVGFLVTFPAGSGIEPAALVLPKPEPYVFEPTGEKLEVYRQPLVIEQPVRFTRETRVPITATLRFQACDDLVCYKPEDVTVTWRE